MVPVSRACTSTAPTNFWSQAKRLLRRYNGIPRKRFPLFLKECEWRVNNGSPAQLRAELLTWIGL